MFNFYLDNYKGKSMVSLFDAIGTLAQSMGENMRNEQIINQLMPLLSKKWNEIPDNN